MRMFNATVELGVPADSLAGELGDQLLERFADHHVVLTRSTLGRGEVILSLPAEGLWQAIAITARRPGEVVGLKIGTWHHLLRALDQISLT